MESQDAFFSYGVFKPGEIGFLRISKWVSGFEEGIVDGYLFERNGVAIFSESPSPSPVGGYLLRFSSPDEAYTEINQVEPEGQYDLREIEVETFSGTTNGKILMVSTNYNQDQGTVGNITHMEPELKTQKQFSWNGNVTWWDGKTDVLFVEALRKIESVLDSAPSQIEPENPDRISGDSADHFFDVQMAYLLLWSVIERYLNIRYATNSEAGWDDWEAMAKSDPFRNKLQEIISDERDGHTILDLHTAESIRQLDRDDPERAISYYRRLRNNIAHRGKDAGRTEYHALYSSCHELYQCFSYTLEMAFNESREYLEN